VRALKLTLIGITLFVLLCVLFSFFVTKKLRGQEGLFRVGSCVKDDEMGVTYKITGLVKDTTSAEVVLSDKYPSQESYKVGYQRNLRSDENPQKLYPIACPR
jgi:hypothetical protein